VRVLVVGWFSFLHGEATAGDLLALEAVRSTLRDAGIEHEVAWSAVMCPAGGLRFDAARPRRYTHLLFVCGPGHGQPVRDLHERFARCRRVAVGVSILDPADPACARFHHVVSRDGPQLRPRPDLAARPVTRTVPVVGVYLTQGQQEYGTRRRHAEVTAALTSWLRGLDWARLALDTRLDPRDWRLNATPDQTESTIRKLDLVVTTRLHGLVLALKNGVPALAVDPVVGGGKVSGQSEAWGWPALLAADRVGPAALDRLASWCLSEAGRHMAFACAAQVGVADASLREMLSAL
jgi:hypothetical protein